MRLTYEDLIAAAAAHPDTIHVVHDSVIIEFDPTGPPPDPAVVAALSVPATPTDYKP